MDHRAFRHQPLGNGAADAAATSGHDGDTAFVLIRFVS
jgi:hypothetical protein